MSLSNGRIVEYNPEPVEGWLSKNANRMKAF